MSNSTFGEQFRITTWGESHGSGIGVVIDGCPAGLTLSSEDIQNMLDRRRPGSSKYTTTRSEEDIASILSGIFEGRTTGTPISVMVRNKDHHSLDYEPISHMFRPGHADYTYQQKYGFRDWRGGGRSSARETVGRVIGGAVAEKLLSEFGIRVTAFTRSIGPVTVDDAKIDLSETAKNALHMPVADTTEAEAFMEQIIADGDSVGGIIECRVSGCPAGLGSPVFGKLDAMLASAVMSIGAVKGVEIGDGFGVSVLRGSENNDPFTVTGEGNIRKKSNHSGGILGGISDGDEIILRAAVKPTASISLPQRTASTDGTKEEIRIAGRHDPCIVPRAVVVVESMVALVLADALLANASSRIESLKKIYLPE